MDIDSTTSLGLFIGFLLVYAYLAFVEGALAAAPPADGARPRPSLLLALQMVAGALSLAAFVVAFVGQVSSLGALALALPLTIAMLLARQSLRAMGASLGAAALPVAAPVLLPFRVAASVRRTVSPPAPAPSGTGWEEGGGEEATDEAAPAALDEGQRTMLRAIIGLEDTWAREVMVPRVDVVAVDKDLPLPDVAQRMVESGHSLLPVYRETIDSVIGAVHSRDILRCLLPGASQPALETLLRPVLFVPEFKPLHDLLEQMRQERLHMAVVIDEYGGTAGMVTMEDILEEIVGEIEDEFSQPEPQVVGLGEGEVIANARTMLDDVNERFSTHLEGEGFDTLGGYVYSRLGRMPKPGDEIEAEGLRIRVVSVSGRRIRRLRITHLPRPERSPANA